MTFPLKIVLIGSGRVAWQLGKRMKSKGLSVVQVISRTPEHAGELGEALNAAWTSDWSELLPEADWVVIAVRDDAVEEVARALAPYGSASLVTHTSGGTPGRVLEPYFPRYGVFYPLQSFSRERSPVWSKIPFCVDAVEPGDVLFLKKMAKTIGNLVYRVNDEQRASLHVAAVFANNFANHCFAIAERLLEEKNLTFELLHPLMEETLVKALQDSPGRMQTGPSVRGDAETVRRHLRLLDAHPDWQDLYARMSHSINPEIEPEGSQ
jgi:predicted short-subunit dehydrogenase-like oxidoreductase (DUF2520 family)